MDISLEYYKIFYYVGKKQSITSAAEELSISQPAVSQAIRHLEKELQVTLFVRTSKGVRFTAEGEMFYSYVQRGYEYILLGEKKLREMRGLEEGEICIGASDMTLRFYLLEYLEQFHEEHPNIKIKVTNAPTPSTLQHLQQGRIDFGVVSTPVQERHNINVQPVREVEDIFVAGRNFENLKGKKLSYHQLCTYPIICLESNTSTRSFVDAFLKKKKITLIPEFELATSDMLIQFAERGLGVACVMADFAKEKIAQGALFQLQFEEKIPKRKIAIVTDSHTPLSAAAKELLLRLRR